MNLGTEERTKRRGAIQARVALFAFVAAVCAAAAVVVVLRARERSAPGPAPVTHPDAQTLEAIRARPHVFYLASSGDQRCQLAVAALDDLAHPRVIGFECLRFHFASGKGIALARRDGKGKAFVLGPDLAIVRTLDCSPLPSRVRVAAGGTVGAWTTFAAGDSYDTSGFSTRTNVLDLVDPHDPAVEPFDLEGLTLLLEGKAVEAPDANYWGVTFPRDDVQPAILPNFYATVQTGGARWLVECDLGEGTARSVHEDVECPSLSPDGKRIAFKKRRTAGLMTEWGLSVLDLGSRTERNLEAEARSVDDQVEWLDDAHILYCVRDKTSPPGNRPDVWKLSVDDGSPPELFLKGALSPCVVRP